MMYNWSIMELVVPPGPEPFREPTDRRTYDVEGRKIFIVKK
jgi:hypothetical protein